MRENWRAVGGSTAHKNHTTINTVIMQMNNLKRQILMFGVTWTLLFKINKKIFTVITHGQCSPIFSPALLPKI